AALIGGLGNGVQWAAFLGVVQGLTPQHLLGRMMGTTEALRSTTPVLGYLLGGVLVAVSTPRIAFLTAGLAAGITVIPFLRGLAPPSGELVDAGSSALPHAQPATQPHQPLSAEPLK
ncbi:MAG: MFS transporter, partial [Solirubrobacteraceae bacterium]